MTRPWPARAVALYALAMFGAHLSYAPLLTLLLPRRVLAVAPEQAAATTSLVVFAGAITASLANIVAGRIGDAWRRRHGNRRAPIALGLGLTVAALVALGSGRSAAALTLGLIAFQAALNVMFAPLSALLVDHFAAEAKARVAAITNLAMPLAAMGTGLAAMAFPHDGAAPFRAVALVVALAVAPLLVFWPFASAQAETTAPASGGREGAFDLALLGLARLLVQFGAVFMGAYFYLFLVQHGPHAGLAPGQPVDPVYGRLVVASTVAVLVATVPVGQWSDRHHRRRMPMALSALAGAAALALVAAGQGLAILAGYALFQVALIAYLSLDAATASQILDRNPRAGEILGYLNLANTLPSVLVPLVVLAITHGAQHTDQAMPWAAGFGLIALAAATAAGLVTRLRQVD